MIRFILMSYEWSLIDCPAEGHDPHVVAQRASFRQLNNKTKTLQEKETKNEKR